MKELYFENIDDRLCQPLECFLNEARYEGKKEITLVKAIPYKGKQYCWCGCAGEVVERSECTKSSCNMYVKPLKGNACDNRGELYNYGESVTFDVTTGEFKLIK